MSYRRSLQSAICLLLVACLLSSCVYRGYFETSKDYLPQFQGRTLRLHFPDKAQSGYYLSELSYSENSIKGILDKDVYAPDYNNAQVVNAYLQSGLVLPDHLPAVFELPVNSIDKLEIYDVDLGKTIFTTTLLIAGITTVLSIIILIIIALTKESCPFIYCFNGEDFEFTGEVYSGAIFPKLERDDYLPLPVLQPKDGAYQLKMANQAEEIQYTNLAELKVVDHPAGTELLVDHKGQFYTVRDAQIPTRAVSGMQEDVLPLLASKDNAKYQGDEVADPNCATDKVEMTFKLPDKADQARLVLKARNSIWLDYTLGQFLDLFGSKYDHWYASQNAKGKGLDPNWSLSQGIPLSVYIKEDGNWKYVDSFPVIGPMADREVVMPLSLKGFKGKELEVKLECGAKFWEIDYAALDCSPQEKVYCQTVGLNSAMTTEGADVSKQLLKSDKKYLVQPKVGDSALLTYPVPKERPGWQRSVFLHCRGHYKVIRKATGEPEITKLEKFREPGSFALFSRQNYQAFKAKYIH